MKPHWRTILVVLGLLAALIAAPAQADRFRGHGPSHGYSHHGGHGYGHSHYGHSRGWAGYGWYSAPLYWGGYGPGYYGPGYGSLSLGYGWGGRHDSYGLALSFPLYFGSRYDPYPRPAPYRSYRYLEPQRAPAAQAAPSPDCRQTREYTTEITIGDQVMPAYGTACLQADGSWKIISGPTIAEE